MTQGNSCLAVA